MRGIWIERLIEDLRRRAGRKRPRDTRGWLLYVAEEIEREGIHGFAIVNGEQEQVRVQTDEGAGRSYRAAQANRARHRRRRRARS